MFLHNQGLRVFQIRVNLGLTVLSDILSLQPSVYVNACEGHTHEPSPTRPRAPDTRPRSHTI